MVSKLKRRYAYRGPGTFYSRLHLQVSPSRLPACDEKFNVVGSLSSCGKKVLRAFLARA
jgi:hypothetical protein